MSLLPGKREWFLILWPYSWEQWGRGGVENCTQGCCYCTGGCVAKEEVLMAWASAWAWCSPASPSCRWTRGLSAFTTVRSWKRCSSLPVIASMAAMDPQECLLGVFHAHAILSSSTVWQGEVGPKGKTLNSKGWTKEGSFIAVRKLEHYIQEKLNHKQGSRKTGKLRLETECTENLGTQRTTQQWGMIPQQAEEHRGLNTQRITKG